MSGAADNLRAVSAPFVHELRVRFRDCDPQGIVFNANYVGYLDDALTELWREAFGSYQAMVDRGVDLVVAELNVEFLAPARFDEEIRIEAAIERLGTTGMSTRFELSREAEPLLSGRIRHVFVDATSWTKTPAPDWVREGLRPYFAP
jgi:acyl-CoA thioester hydrolase